MKQLTISVLLMLAFTHSSKAQERYRISYSRYIGSTSYQYLSTTPTFPMNDNWNEHLSLINIDYAKPLNKRGRSHLLYSLHLGKYSTEYKERYVRNVNNREVGDIIHSQISSLNAGLGIGLQNILIGWGKNNIYAVTDAGLLFQLKEERSHQLYRNNNLIEDESTINGFSVGGLAILQVGVSYKRNIDEHHAIFISSNLLFNAASFYNLTLGYSLF